MHIVHAAVLEILRGKKEISADTAAYFALFKIHAVTLSLPCRQKRALFLKDVQLLPGH